MVTINKIIILLFILSNIAYGLKLEVFSNKTYGNISLEITDLTSKTATIKSNSNVFSVNGDHSFGTYTVKSDLSSVLISLNKINVKIKKLEQTLALSKSSLSSLYKGKEHDFYIKIDDKTIANTSPFYNSIKKQIDNILSTKSKEVVKEFKLIDSDLKVTTSGKSKTEVYDKEKNCSGTAKSGVCRISDKGFISL